MVNRTHLFFGVLLALVFSLQPALSDDAAPSGPSDPNTLKFDVPAGAYVRMPYMPGLPRLAHLPARFDATIEIEAAHRSIMWSSNVAFWLCDQRGVECDRIAFIDQEGLPNYALVVDRIHIETESATKPANLVSTLTPITIGMPIPVQIEVASADKILIDVKGAHDAQDWEQTLSTDFKPALLLVQAVGVRATVKFESVSSQVASLIASGSASHGFSDLQQQEPSVCSKDTCLSR